MTQQMAGPVFFKLKNAKEYGFWGRGGQRKMLVKAGEVVQMNTQADIDYFRARKDVMVECTPDGVPMDEEGRKGHLIPGKPKSYRVFGRRAQPQGTPQPVAQIAPAADRPMPKVTRVGAPTVAAAVAKPVVVVSSPISTHEVDPMPPQAPVQPRQALQAPAATQAFYNTHETVREVMSPIEEARPDGSTETVRPRVDPGR